MVCVVAVSVGGHCEWDGVVKWFHMGCGEAEEGCLGAWVDW